MSKSKIQFEGSGPGHQTQDGCSVELYRLYPAGDDPERIAAQLSTEATILELGCGVGRVTHPLLEKGFQVTAVDNSGEMLAHIHGAKKICADIEELNLKKRFDCVLLMSHMLNVPYEETRKALLATCQRHLKKEGIVIIQCHNPAGFAKLKPGLSSERNGIKTTIDHLAQSGNIWEMAVCWEVNGTTWTQSFHTMPLNRSEIDHALQVVGLTFNQWIDDAQTWFAASLG